MRIKYIEMSAHPGGLSKITAVVDGERNEIAEAVRKAAKRPEGYALEIKPIRKQRSLDANAYLWKLTTDLARVLRTSTDELHEQLLQDYGVYKTINGLPVTFTLRADIDPHEVTPYTKVIKTGEIGGKMAVMYGVLKGSSEMDTKEFSDLLDGLIYECKEQGIETLPPEELARLKAQIEG